MDVVANAPLKITIEKKSKINFSSQLSSQFIFNDLISDYYFIFRCRYLFGIIKYVHIWRNKYVPLMM